MKIVYAQIENLLGLTEAKIEPGHITFIEGHNGAGKSALVESIQAAFSARGIEGEIVTKGSDRGMVFVKLDDGHQVKAKFDASGKKTVQVITPDGDMKKSPQTWLDALFGQSIVNPVQFLHMSTTEKRKAILSALPIKVGHDELVEWFGIGFDVDTDKHGLEVMAEVEKRLYEDRKAANATVRSLTAEAEVMEKSIPAGFNAAEWQDVDTSSLTEELQAIGRLEEQKRQKAGEATTASHFAGKHRNDAEMCVAQIEKLEAEIAQWQQRITEAQDRIIVLRTDEANHYVSAAAKDNESNSLMAEAEAMVVPDKAEIEAKLADYSNAQRILQQLANLKRLEAEIAVAEGAANDLDAWVELARQKPKELLAASSLPIDGLEFTEDSILVNGLTIDSLSDGEKLSLGVKIAQASTGPLGFIVIDGAEALDPDNLQHLLDSAQADPNHHYVITRVTAGDLKVTTEAPTVADHDPDTWVDPRQTSLF